ncbi:serine/threonine-protein kinase TBK1 [Octopus bimaculoides]|uniref:Protein kinase domain-containing protein n=1 Tax=Octopus bimaculoides TaxID=37653 RepID=A0A0L8H2N2_OCTBM|nr:serine/threonine-protein kinase TBK1 [Octopus bimaculoides]|eukprot:XP_014775910.1 PREDICTED: serine/threonine-protein kinase TBK1-like [Octopus bimaculoides]
MFESKTFTYDVLLGKGATACVYKGISKIDSQCYALKVFNSNGPYMRKSIQNEVSILKKLNHENIVRFIDVEFFSDRAVIVMELLEHGTLLNQLQKPKNKFGFSERKLLGLLKDINSGLKILRQFKIVHRDIKPSNILRTINVNGREIYKLSDFGTAKIMEEETELYSIVGTEEYLHPNLFGRAFINDESNGVKDADAWSLGVMLYHVITGHIPFQTQAGYRRNRQLRYEMLSRKPNLAISANETETDAISWETELPETCKLSSIMKRKFEKIIRHLFITSNDSASIQDYLNKIDNILNKRDISIFQPSTGRLVTCYLDKNAKIPYLKDKIAKEFNIRSDEQMLFFNFIEVTSDSTAISYFTSNKKKKPLLLIEKCPVYIELDNSSYLKEIVPSSSTILSYAKDVCSILHRIKKEFKCNVRTYDHIYHAVCILNSLTLSEMLTCEELIKNFELSEIVKDKAQNIHNCESLSFDTNPNQLYKSTKAQYKDVKDLIDKLKSNEFDSKTLNQKRSTLETMYKNALLHFEKSYKDKVKTIERFRQWKKDTLNNLKSIREFKGFIFKQMKEKMSSQKINGF